MINITRLYCDKSTPGDEIRYGISHKKNESGFRLGSERKPVVVWNTTRSCNLRCVHCYTDSESKKYEGELSTDEAKLMIEDLAQFGVPVLLFSGGEPLIRPDIFVLVRYAHNLGIKPGISTNGTLITQDVSRILRDIGELYIGISLDGIGEVNDYFRGKKGAFNRAVEGIRNAKEFGHRVSLRLTLTKHNFQNLHQIFDFIEVEGIQRACFYHLVYAGRGRNISGDDLSHQETREALDIIIERASDFAKRQLDVEVLTVDNHADAAYMYLKLKLISKEPERAQKLWDIQRKNGGGLYSSGVGIGNVDFCGNVHADQFWMYHSFGNVRQRAFSQIWMDTSEPLMAALKDKRAYIKGRCASCKFLDICGGASRVRADFVYNDPWASDPACYLTDQEIGV